MKKSMIEQIDNEVINTKVDVGKNLVCNPIMMKTFDGNSSFIRLGINKATQIGSQTLFNTHDMNATNTLSNANTTTNNITNANNTSGSNNGINNVNSDNNMPNTGNSSQNVVLDTNSKSDTAHTEPSPNRVKNSVRDGIRMNNSLLNSLSGLGPCPVVCKPNPFSSVFNRSFSGNPYSGQSPRSHHNPDNTVNTLSRINSLSNNSVSNSSVGSNSFSSEGSMDKSTDKVPYSTFFDSSDESINILKKMFSSNMTPTRESGAVLDDGGKFEWIPSDADEPTSYAESGAVSLGTSDCGSTLPPSDILGLFEDNFEDECDGYLLSSYYNYGQSDLDTRLRNLSSVHESLYTSSDVATLRTLEKFLINLLQNTNQYGNLTPFGKLLAFINLSYLNKHIKMLESLYNHQEMSILRKALNNTSNNTQGQISKTLNTSAGLSEMKVSNEEALNAFTQLLNKTGKEISSSGQSVTTSTKSKTTSSGIKYNKQRLTIVDTLSSMYKTGGEPHFPRFVCGSVDRSKVVQSETISIPFDKSERHNIHVQFEKFNSTDSNMWPKLNTLPQTITEQTFVQVAPLKYGSLMGWKAGTVASISSGQLMIRVPNELKERMYLLRNFIPPNVPVVKLEKGYWRLLPRELDVNTDLYVGSCLSLLNLAENDESIDVVVVNLFFSTENSPIAPIKPPSDETNFYATSDNNGNTGDRNNNLEKKEENNGDVTSNSVESGNADNLKSSVGTCRCDGFSLRIFEGKYVGVPERILVHSLHDKKEHEVKVSELRGFKLNYDLQSHFDGSSLNGQFPNGVWVVPRNISFLGNAMLTKDSARPGFAWLFRPELCLMIFPFSRTVDVLQDLCRLIPFLHPELNYLALCAGLWSLRNNPELRERESVSYTRSQKAAIRDLTSNDVVNEVCADVLRCPFSLIRRLYACFPVFSLWIALDLYDPENDPDPTIPTDITPIPLTRCEKCGGTNFKKTGITKIVQNKYNNLLKSITTSSGNNVESADSSVTVKSFEGNWENNSNTTNTGNAKNTIDTNNTKDNTNNRNHNATNNTGSDNQSNDVNGDFKDMNNSGIETIPVLTDLERVEEMVKRFESLANSRWRMTREFTASYSLDDEISMLTTSPPSTARTNSEFILQLAGLMSNVKKGKDVQVDPTMVFKLCQLAEECTSPTESALLTGWSTCILGDPKDDINTQNTHSRTQTKPKDLLQTLGAISSISSPGVCPLNAIKSNNSPSISLNSPSISINSPCISLNSPCIQINSPKKLNLSSLTCPSKIPNSNTINQIAINTNNISGNNINSSTFNANLVNINFNTNLANNVNMKAGCPIRRCPIDLTSNYTQLLANNPILTDLSNMYKRKREVDVTRKDSDLGKRFSDITRRFSEMNKKDSEIKRDSDNMGRRVSDSGKVGIKYQKGGMNLQVGLQVKQQDLATRKPKQPEKEAEYIDDPHDFCKFNDRPKRRAYISSIKWDEDLEI